MFLICLISLLSTSTFNSHISAIRFYQDRQRDDFIIHSKLRRKGAQKFWVSVRGGYSLAIKRNLGTAGSEALVLALEARVQRRSVVKLEHTLAIALMLQSRAWYAYQYAFQQQCLTLSSEEAGGLQLSYVIHTVRGDATNSAVGQHASKAHTCEVNSFFKHAFVPEDFEARAGELVRPEPYECCRRAFADLQRVPEHCGAMESRALFLKQVF